MRPERRLGRWVRRGGSPQHERALASGVHEYSPAGQSSQPRSDAHVLGAMPAFGGRGLDPVYVPVPAQHALQRLTKQRHRYQELICSARRRVLDLIRWACPALEDVLPDTTTRLTLAILSEYFVPQKVVTTRRDVLGRFLALHASGNHPKSGPFIDEMVAKLKAAATETIALHGETVCFEDLQFEVRQEVEHLRLWAQHIVDIERRVEVLYEQLHPSDALCSIPGIGPTIAPLLVGAMGNGARFRNETHIRGFCGMFPAKNSSGGLDKPGQRLTKSGNDRVKRALYIAADVARKIDPDLAALYWRLMVQKGHHHKQAIWAVATRLVNRIYRVLKTGIPYQLRDLEGSAITVQQGKSIVGERFVVPPEIRRSRSKARAAVAL